MPTPDHATPELDPPAMQALADALGESPETIMSVHRLRRGLARAWATATGRASVIQGTLLPEEPHVFGRDPAAILALLRHVPGWTCVNAPEAHAPALAALIAQETGTSPILGPERYFTLPPDAPLPPPPPGSPASAPAPVLLTADSRQPAAVLNAATIPLGMAGWRFGSAERLVNEGIVAGVIEDGELVAVAFTSALGDQFAEIGVVTREDHRGKGHATASAALVCGEVRRRGITPVWSTAEDNRPSLRVAETLGFRPVSRRIYICRG